MSRSNFTYQSLREYLNNEANHMFKRNPRMFKTLEVLARSAQYSTSEAFHKYISLCDVVDFTKIADMLYLITHYGAISDLNLQEISDEKVASTMISRKIHSDRYLTEYQLPHFDFALDELYREPIGLKDKSRWYSIASSFLTNAFRAVKLQIDKLSDKLYFTNAKNERVFIEEFSIGSFADFLEIVLHTSEIFEYRLDWTSDLIIRYVTSMVEGDQFSTDSITNDIIQFDDYYVKNGIFIEGRYPYIPRFYIDQDVSNVIKTRKPTKIISEVDEFILHLSDYDYETAKVFLSRMSTFLLNNENLKTNFSATINVLYGASGQNGKSLFMTMLKKIFSQDDITLAGLRDFNNQNYLLPKMCQSLLVVDEDAADLQLDSAATSNLKQFAHGQRMESRSIYEKSRSYRPRAMVVACTNHMPTSVDKSNGFNRRFSIFTQTCRLVNREHARSEEWFDVIKSDEASKYLLELLILAHLDNMKRGRLLENSERMKEINEDFVEKNDTAVMYVRSVGLRAIVGKPVRLVREDYERWCEDNGVTALKNKFNTTLETKFGLKSKLVSTSKLTVDESTLRMNGFSEKMKQVKAWVHTDEEITHKYLEIYRSEMLKDSDIKCLYTIDMTKSNSALSKEIVETLEESDEIVNATSDEINHKVSILMNEESEDRTSKVIKKVKSRLANLYHTEVKTVKDLDKEELDRYLAVGKYNKSLAAALKDPRRQVLIYSEKKDISDERNEN